MEYKRAGIMKYIYSMYDLVYTIYGGKGTTVIMQGTL